MTTIVVVAYHNDRCQVEATPTLTLSYLTRVAMSLAYSKAHALICDVLLYLVWSLM
jgi:hypothetical protein